ncbi:MAG: outer membrane protein assembly factor BamA [Moraxellaceae bacterium]|nr:outer membrane protein assembly factor BamA [Moraxellaceae bacterium]
MAVIPLVIAGASVGVYAKATDNVVVSNIRFLGLERITEESLLPLLPVKVGSIMDEKKLATSLEALYSSEYFSDIQAKVLKDGSLEFSVKERPIIAEVSFKGNKLIPKKGLEQGFKKSGLAQGEVLKQSTLVGVANELQQQYIQQGYYNSDINVNQRLLEGNRAKVDFEFNEGEPAKVIDINIIGNKYFSDQEIKDILLLKENSWKRVFSKSDHFARNKLKESLKRLAKMYLDAGFVRFSVKNSIVNISDDKKKVYIELSLDEGGRYQFGDVNFLGQHDFNSEDLNKLVEFRAMDRYSQEELNKTTEKLKSKFTNEGYYFAQIRPVKHIDDETKTVNVDFYIDPVKPIYVRRIIFDGNTRTKDEVLRREMRQLEGTLTSTDKIELSRRRLMQTGHFKKVEVAISPVINQPDQVDLVYKVKEQSTGSSTIAAGYSERAGVTFQLEMNQNNFMGTGNRVNASMSRSETSDSYNISHRNPFITENGVSQTVSGYYRKTKYDNKNVSNYITDSMGASLSYGYPVDEKIRVNAGLNIDKTDLRGGRWMGVSNVQELLDDGGEVIRYTGDDANKYNFNKDYQTYNLLLGWDYNSLDKPIFPTEGMKHSVDLTFGFGDKTYQKAVYRGNIYQPLTKNKKLIARGYAKLGYGNDLPFYDNFYAGGYGSVRGYRHSSLGPQSTTFYDTQSPQSFGTESVGGNAIATIGTELILPMPFKGDWAEKIRPALFVEGGQVFDTTGKEDRTFSYNGSKAVPLLKQDNKPRFSAGVGLTWYTPIGPIALSYSQPFNDQDGDRTENVQFQIGNIF